MSAGLEFWHGDGCGLCVGGGSRCVEAGEVAMRAGKGAHRGLRCGAEAAFVAVSRVEQVEFISSVSVGGVRTMVPWRWARYRCGRAQTGLSLARLRHVSSMPAALWPPLSWDLGSGRTVVEVGTFNKSQKV